jgi:hypothetical protein
MGVRALNSPAVVLAVILAAMIGIHTATAQTEPGAGEAFVPVEEYARKVDEFKKNAPNLNKKIEDSTKTIENLDDVPKARSEIEQLRGVVAELLDRVSNNGELARLGAKALDH